MLPTCGLKTISLALCRFAPHPQVEGIDNLRLEKGYAVSDERHRLTLYGEAQLPWRFSLAPIYTFGSGVAGDTFLPGTGNINGASGSRLPLLPRNAIGREVKNTSKLNAAIDRWNALPPCPAAYPCLGGTLQSVPAGINFYSPFSSLDLRLKKDFRLGERASVSLIGEGFNMFNETNIRGSRNANCAGVISRSAPTRRHRTASPHKRSRPTSIRLSARQAVSSAPADRGPFSLPHASSFKSKHEAHLPWTGTGRVLDGCPMFAPAYMGRKRRGAAFPTLLLRGKRPFADSARASPRKGYLHN